MTKNYSLLSVKHKNKKISDNKYYKISQKHSLTDLILLNNMTYEYSPIGEENFVCNQ